MGWLAAACVVAACFKDDGLPPLASGGASTGEPATATSEPDPSSGGAPTTATGDGSTGEASTGFTAVCGNHVIELPVEVCDDGNTIDTDACRKDCRPAECGDEVVWEGVEECDDGAGNDPLLPSACRPGCVKPKCGDGAIYVGPLGAPIDVGGGPGTTAHSDDAPRAIAALADGTFRVLWRVDAENDALFVQELAADGTPTSPPLDFLPLGSAEARDPVLAVAGGGDLLVGWETNSNGGDLRVRGLIAGDMTGNFTAHEFNAGPQDSISLALADTGAAAVAFVGTTNNLSRIFLRWFPNIATLGQAPPETPISLDMFGLVSSPTVAMRPSGEFVVAWGDAMKVMNYRRFGVDGAPAGEVVTTTLQVGGGVGPPNAKPWTGAALRPDGSVAIVGVDGDAQLAVHLFGTADAQAGAVQITADFAFVPFVDVASDAWGNLAVAWVGCGSVDNGGDDCSALPQTRSLRWFYADLTPFAPAETVLAQPLGSPAPIGLAVAPSGATAITYVEGEDVLVRVAPVSCPL
jgi:cysteine-rich repeat protein